MLILINFMNENDFIFDQIVQINERNKFCQKYHKILIVNISIYNNIKSRNSCNVDDILYEKNKL